MLALAIDTASDLAGVALIEDGLLLAETTWRTRQNHSRQLLPAVDSLLTRAERAKENIEAVFVCLGPGSYAGMRVGVSTAKALAFGLDAAIVGVNRLAADALPAAMASRGPVVAAHAAGRAELAWAVYAWSESGLEEIDPPQLSKAADLAGRLAPEYTVCTDLATLPEAVKLELTVLGIRLVDVHASRVIALARLGWQRLVAGDVDNIDALVPLYLRAPAIGPQPPP